MYILNYAGRFGMVYKAEIHRGTSSKTVVVKPVGEITAEVWREVSQVVHPNAISLCGLIDEGKVLYYTQLYYQSLWPPQ